MQSYILINKQEAESLQMELERSEIKSDVLTIQDQGKIFYEINIESDDEDLIRKAMDACGLGHAENLKTTDAVSTKYKIGGLLIVLVILLLIAYAYDKIYLTK